MPYCLTIFHDCFISKKDEEAKKYRELQINAFAKVVFMYALKGGPSSVEGLEEKCGVEKRYQYKSSSTENRRWRRF